jgi:hypothetical protein
VVDKSDLPALAMKSLGDLVAKPGVLLYSSHETLRPGEVYFLGFNPGGDDPTPLQTSVPHMLSQTDNAYLDHRWAPGGKLHPAGKAPMQMRTVHALEHLGAGPRDVCSSNLIFVRSGNATGVEPYMADRCWPVHQAMLDIVQPRVIVSCGNSGRSAYAYLKGRFGSQESSAPSGHGGYWLKHFDTVIDGRQCRVLGLPHLSWYKPQGRPEFIEWVREVAQS